MFNASCFIISGGIPSESYNLNKSFVVISLVINFETICLYFCLVASYFIFSTFIIFSTLCKFSLNSGYNGFKYSACNSKTLDKSIFQSYFSINANALLKIILKLYPPPTFEGSAESVIATNNARECSATEYKACNGKICSFNSSEFVFNFLAINFQEFSI